MRGLLRSELLRFRSRRNVWILSLLVVAGAVIGSLLVATHSHHPSDAALAAATASYERALGNCESAFAQGTIRLITGAKAVTPGQACQRMVSLSNYVPRGTFGLIDLPQVLQGTAFIFIVVGLVIGASSIGADWQSGTMGTLLTWEPRRIRLFVVRVIVVCVGVFLIAAVLEAWLTALLALAASTRGSTAWLDSAWATDSVKTAARVAGMASFGALLGLSVSMIGRATGAALAVVFVYLAVFESLVRAIRPSTSHWLLGPNIAVFISATASRIERLRTLTTFAHSVLVISLFAVIPFVAALIWFRGRDAGN